MKSRDTILLFSLILLYLIAIMRSVFLYLTRLNFPNMEYSMNLTSITQNFLPYEIFIKIFMILAVLSLIIGFFAVKKELRGSFEKIPIPIIVVFSALPPAFSLLNDYLTGDFAFSVVLIVYGVLFTTLSLKFRVLE